MPNATFTFGASTYGSALLIFDDDKGRDDVVGRSPLRFAGINISFLRPEDIEDRSTASYGLLVELAASNFPLELWHEAGAAFVFNHVGRLCCVDRTWFDGSDRSSVRGFVQIQPTTTIPPTLTLHLPSNDVLTVYPRIIEPWVIGLGAPFRLDPSSTPHPPSPAQSHDAFAQFAPRARETMDGIDCDDGPQIVPSVVTPRELGTPTLASTMRQLSALTKEAHSRAAAAADNVVVEADALVDSIRGLAVSSFHAGSSSTAPSPVHENEVRKRRVQAKRANDDAKKLRRSHRIAAKAEENYIDMLSKAIKKKTDDFDEAGVTDDLAATLAATGLTDNPELPCIDIPALVAVALACGADEDDVAVVADDEVAPPSP